MAVLFDMSATIIRAAREDDLGALLLLYSHLGDNPMPEPSERIASVWRQILGREGHTILIAELCGEAVSTCAITIVPNLTHGQRPYALVENVVTLPSHRGRGIATAVLREAAARARQAGCYKIWLTTGSKRPETLEFYRRAGFDDTVKTAFHMKL